MGIYGVKSTTCNCKGSWSTLTNDKRIYMTKPCEEHILIEGNTIYYELKHILNYIIKNFTGIRIKDKYLVKILQIEKVRINKTLIKFEVIHNGELNIENFNKNKNIIFSQMNDEPMWNKIDDNIIHFTLVYQSPHHTVEANWEALDY